MNGFSYIPDDDEIKREKNKARALRATQWWKRKCAKGICFYCHQKFPARELTMGPYCSHFQRRAKHQEQCGPLLQSL